MQTISVLKKKVSTSVNQTLRWTAQRFQAAVPYRSDNPFLEGAFAPVQQEYTIENLEVQGEIPAVLSGVLMRIGPNPLEVDNPANYNWFMGDGMVHGVRLEQGRACWYKNRYVGSDPVTRKLGLPRAAGSRRSVTDIVNTNIIGYAGKVWALVEAGSYPVEMDAELNTVRHGLFNSKAELGFTAHPHIDPDSGEIHAVCYDAINRSVLNYLHIGTDGQLKKQVKIPVQHGPMVHDCAITQSKVIILDLPITFSYKRVIQGSQLPYLWNPKHQARIGLLPRDSKETDSKSHAGKGDTVQWFNIDPCYVFHTCNAYDLQNGDVILDVIVHEKSFSQSIQGPAEQQQVRFERWTLHHASRRLTRKVISDIKQEFPRFDERLTGKPYRYAYTVGFDSNLSNLKANQLYRHDLQTGETLTHNYGANYMTGEVVFVPRHAQSNEDEGWLMSYVHDLDGGPSQIVILDAQKIGQPAQAVIQLPVRVPLGFHGNWIPSP